MIGKTATGSHQSPAAIVGQASTPEEGERQRRILRRSRSISGPAVISPVTGCHGFGCEGVSTTGTLSQHRWQGSASGAARGQSGACSLGSPGAACWQSTSWPLRVVHGKRGVAVRRGHEGERHGLLGGENCSAHALAPDTTSSWSVLEGGCRRCGHAGDAKEVGGKDGDDRRAGDWETRGFRRRARRSRDEQRPWRERGSEGGGRYLGFKDETGNG